MLAQLICADPPWGFSDGLKAMKDGVKRSAQSQYKTMSAGEVAGMPVPSIVDPAGCLLALWVPGSMLQAGLDVMTAWGFKQKQVWVWTKLKKDHEKELDPNKRTRVGMGHLFRQSHEIALIGTAGKSIYPLLKNKGQRSVGFDLNLGHSIKPETLQNSLDLMFPSTFKVELFARRSRLNWTCLGDAIDGKDICTAIHDLAMQT